MLGLRGQREGQGQGCWVCVSRGWDRARRVLGLGEQREGRGQAGGLGPLFEMRKSWGPGSGEVR